MAKVLQLPNLAPAQLRGMNRTEAAYAEQLEADRLAGIVASWRYEAIKLRLADKTWYTPDFFVITTAGGIDMVEVKGWWRDDARVKIKVAAEMYPEFRFRAVSRTGGGWKMEAF